MREKEGGGEERMKWMVEVMEGKKEGRKTEVERKKKDE